MLGWAVRNLTIREAEGWCPPDGGTDAGERVDDGSVLGLAAAWACVNLLAGTISTLPLMVYRTRNGQREEARDHPLYRLLHDSPNADQTAVDFWEYQNVAIELRGNSFAEVSRAADGRPIALTPISPAIMSVSRKPDGALEYRWTDRGVSNRVDETKVFHVRGPGGDPLGGMSTISVARQTFGTALAVNRSAASTFRNGMRPSGVYKTEAKLNPETQQQLESLLDRKYAGAAKTGRPLVLGHGLDWQSISIKPEEAQLLESRGMSVEEVWRLDRVQRDG